MITLVLGGARSGKSEVAEAIAEDLAALAGAGAVPDGTATDSAVVGSVTYLATLVDGGDADLAARIRAHRARRPRHWATVEVAGSLPDALRQVRGIALVDSLGPWVSAAPGMAVDGAALCGALCERDGDTVVVSEEVGWGVHPASEAGRAFRDALGVLNQTVAAVADEVLLVVAGRKLRLEAGPER
jgi:adenosylcobinamide kinase / adenosylcobinamide-phosphate guanylyltransferase